MTKTDDIFNIRPGRVRNSSLGRELTHIDQVLLAAKKTGNRSATKERPSGFSSFGRGRIAYGRSRLFSSHRRVLIKARISRQTALSTTGAPIAGHLAYLKRDGVTRDHEPATMFDAANDRANDVAFAARCEDDRHHFRFIISPEDAAQMTDLRSFTRDLTMQMERDLGTRLDWVAVDHWNTDNPHVHLIIRGVDDTGADLVIARDYISNGLRSRAEDLVAIELGPKAEHDIRSSLEHEINAQRWTRLDRAIKDRANEQGNIDLRPEHPGPEDPLLRRLMTSRLQQLETMGLAIDAGPGEWVISSGAESLLCDLGERGDIIKTMHRVLRDRGLQRPNLAVTQDPVTSPVIGQLIATGLHDELSGEAFAMIDGVDGRTHHVRFKSIEAFAHAPATGGIVEVRSFGGQDDPNPTRLLANRSDLNLSQQITAPGATWLDHRLVDHSRLDVSQSGFGAEVMVAMAAREQFLIDQGLASRHGNHVLLQRNLLETLRRQEVEAMGARLASEYGMTHQANFSGEKISGTYRRIIKMSSGRFAMIENGLGFQLVPWSSALEKNLGCEVSGVVRSNGGVDWSRKSRGLEI